MQIEIYETKSEWAAEPVEPARPGEIVVVMPSIDLGAAMQAGRMLIHRAGRPMRMVVAHDTVQQGFIRTVNQFSKLLKPEFLVYVAQDVMPGRNWLGLAWDCLQREQGQLFAFNEGRFAGQYASFGLVRTAFTNGLYGEHQIFHHEYHSHWADIELTLLASNHSGLCIDLRALLMEVDYRTFRTANLKDMQLFRHRIREVLKLKPELVARFDYLRAQ